MTWFFGNRKSLIFTLVVVFALAVGIRFYDLTDLPLDFASTRQLFSALKARSMYYAMLPASSTIPTWQREMAARQSTAIIEPPIIETIVAWTYRITGEHLWIARIYSSMFWVLAGILLFLLASELSSASGALIALLFFLFLPYGVIASRSFQPDPLMVAMIVAGAWATFRWANQRTWKWAAIAGILNGLAILVKNVSVFPLGFAAIALVLEFGLLKSLKDLQTWLVLLLSVLLPGAYTVYGLYIASFLTSQFAFRFFPQLWPTGGFYLRWLGQIEGVLGFGAFAAAIVGALVARRRSLAFLIGLFAGYFVYGMTFAYHITTHDYYQLPLIPIVALGLAPLADVLFEHLQRIRSGWFIRAAVLVMLALVTALQMWNVRVQLVRTDWRPEQQFWTALGDKLGRSAGTVLTISQDYGYRLEYWGWQDVEAWYSTGDLDLRSLDNRQIDVMQRFQQSVAGKKFLVVTQSGQFDAQPDIKEYVYKTYPVFEQGKGYIIFDLSHPLNP